MSVLSHAHHTPVRNGGYTGTLHRKNPACVAHRTSPAFSDGHASPVFYRRAVVSGNTATDGRTVAILR